MMPSAKGRSLELFFVDGNPAGMLTPLLVKNHFQGGAWELSMMESAMGVGVILGSLVLSAWIRIWAIGAVTGQLQIRVGGGDAALLPNNSDKGSLSSSSSSSMPKRIQASCSCFPADWLGVRLDGSWTSRSSAESEAIGLCLAMSRRLAVNQSCFCRRTFSTIRARSARKRPSSEIMIRGPYLKNSTTAS